MSKRVLVCLALTAALPVYAVDLGGDSDLDAGSVRQLNATQAHLQEMQPKDQAPRRSVGPALARLVGKMVSSQVKGLNLELSNEAEPSALGMQDPQGAVRLNRRAEICYENYRLGIKRGGVQMRYELTF